MQIYPIEKRRFVPHRQTMAGIGAENVVRASVPVIWTLTIFYHEAEVVAMKKLIYN